MNIDKHLSVLETNLNNIDKCAELLTEWVKVRRATLTSQLTVSALKSHDGPVTDIKLKRLEIKGAEVFAETNAALVTIVELINLQKELCVSLTNV